MALGMDANRNFVNYVRSNHTKISEFIGYENWTDDRDQFNSSKEFIRYLSSTYDKNMIKLGYKKPEKKQEIRSYTKNLSLYYLALYSKHELGNKFWKEMQKYTDNQLGLF
jgi:hypothetical protein